MKFHILLTLATLSAALAAPLATVERRQSPSTDTNTVEQQVSNTDTSGQGATTDQSQKIALVSTNNGNDNTNIIGAQSSTTDPVSPGPDPNQQQPATDSRLSMSTLAQLGPSTASADTTAKDTTLMAVNSGNGGNGGGNSGGNGGGNGGRPVFGDGFPEEMGRPIIPGSAPSAQSFAAFRSRFPNGLPGISQEAQNIFFHILERFPGPEISFSQVPTQQEFLALIEQMKEAGQATQAVVDALMPLIFNVWGGKPW